MHLILLGACITNMVNSKNGGRTPQAKASRSSKIALLNSTPVREQFSS